MEKYINEYNKEVWRGVEDSSIFDTNMFFEVPDSLEDVQYALHTNLGSLTVLDRMTGFGFRDIETGFRDPDGKFWLASCNCDVRESGSKTIGDAIAWVKQNANTVRHED